MRDWIIYTLFDKSINEPDFTKTFMSSVLSFRRIKTLIDGKIKSVISFFFLYIKILASEQGNVICEKILDYHNL